MSGALSGPGPRSWEDGGLGHPARCLLSTGPSIPRASFCLTNPTNEHCKQDIDSTPSFTEGQAQAQRGTEPGPPIPSCSISFIILTCDVVMYDPPCSTADEPEPKGAPGPRSPR